MHFVVWPAMAENGIVAMDQEDTEPMETQDTEDRTEDYPKLIEYGINEKVAQELDKIYTSGKFSIFCF